MPRCARRSQMNPRQVERHHCSSQCVRRSSFRDRTVGGLDLDHRREWFHQRVEDLATFFAVQVCDRSVVDNQIHLILRNRPDLVAKMSDREVVERWLRFSSKSLELNPVATLEEIERHLADREWVAELRLRLSSISWFMWMLKEPIAREANAEDGVRGHFFAERFDSAELMDDEEVLIASLYINSLEVNHGLADRVDAARLKPVGRSVDEGDNPPVAAAQEVPVVQPMSETIVREVASDAGAAGDQEAADDRGAAGDQEAAGDSSGKRNVERTSSSQPVPEVRGGDAGSVDTSSYFHRLPLEDYCQWLAKHVRPGKPSSSLATGEPCASVQEAVANQAVANQASVAGTGGNGTGGNKAAGKRANDKTAAREGKRRVFHPGISALVVPILEVPEQLPSGWERFGLDRERWAEAVPIIARRFRRYAYRAAALRLDCQHLIASSTG